MSKVSPLVGNMNAGELSPMLGARVDFAKYPSGASILENFVPTVQGPIERRGGTRFVGEVKSSASRVLLQPFEFSVSQAYMLEFGDFYCRFYTWDDVTKVRGLLESSPGVAVEVVTPYSTADLFNADGTPRLRFAQSGDLLYIAHGLYQQRTIQRVSATEFVINLYEAKGGPWKSLNETGIGVAASAETGAITLTATQPLFNASHVDSLFYMEEPNTNSNKSWEVSKAITAGARRRSDSKTYEALNSATTGTNKPVHTDGALLDGDAGVQWQYRDAGYGYVRITGFTSPTSVSAVVIDRLPATLVNVASAPVKTISSVSNVGGNVQAVVTGHGYATGADVMLNIRVRKDNYLGPDTFINYSSNHQVVAVVDADTIRLDAAYEVVFPSASRPHTFESGNVQQTGVLSTRWAFGEWSTDAGWPADVAFFRERLWWGRKQQVWGSVAADFTDYSPKTFGQVTADMAITVTLVSGRINDVHWMTGDEELLCGTSGGEFSVGELTNGDPIGPGNVRARLISSYGSRAIPPIKNGDALLFVQRSGLKAREVSYDSLNLKYQSSDATVLAEHITRTGVLQIAFSIEPSPVVWAIRADGLLIGYTWNAEQEVRGWHRHPVGGAGVVESIAVMPAAEGDGSELWLVVRRTINGVTRRYVEYMNRAWREGDTQASAFYVDSGLTYSGSPTSTISGLGHLEGQTVDVLIDGAAHPQRVVTAGSISLQRAASVVQVGLPCPCKYRSMRLEGGSRDGTSQGKTKRIHKGVLRFLNTGGGSYGSSDTNLDDLQFRQASDPMNAPVPLFSGDKVVPWPEGYNSDAYMMFVNEQPTPAILVGLMPQMVVNDAL